MEKNVCTYYIPNAYNISACVFFARLGQRQNPLICVRVTFHSPNGTDREKDRKKIWRQQQQPIIIITESSGNRDAHGKKSSLWMYNTLYNTFCTIYIEWGNIFNMMCLLYYRWCIAFRDHFVCMLVHAHNSFVFCTHTSPFTAALE